MLGEQGMQTMLALMLFVLILCTSRPTSLLMPAAVQRRDECWNALTWPSLLLCPCVVTSHSH